MRNEYYGKSGSNATARGWRSPTAHYRDDLRTSCARQRYLPPPSDAAWGAVGLGAPDATSRNTVLQPSRLQLNTPARQRSDRPSRLVRSRISWGSLCSGIPQTTSREVPLAHIHKHDYPERIAYICAEKTEAGTTRRLTGWRC